MKGAESDGGHPGTKSNHQLTAIMEEHQLSQLFPTLLGSNSNYRSTLIDLCFVSALTQFTFGVTPLAGIVTTCYFMHLDQ